MSFFKEINPKTNWGEPVLSRLAKSGITGNSKKEKPEIITGHWANFYGNNVDRYFIGETIYYVVVTRNIPDGTIIKLQLFEKEDKLHLKDAKLNQEFDIKIESGFGRVAVKINETIASLSEKNKESLTTGDDYRYQHTEIFNVYGKLFSKYGNKSFRSNFIHVVFELESQGLEKGVGNVEEQQYTVEVYAASSDFYLFQLQFLGHPEMITSNKLATYTPFDKNNDGYLTEGDQIEIDIWGPVNGSVKVAKLVTDKNRFELYFQALQGHPDAGNIRFSGQFIENYFDFTKSKIVFEIFNITRTNLLTKHLDVYSQFPEATISRAAQRKQWLNVLANFCNYFETGPVKATFHLINKKWNASTNEPGSIVSNNTTDILEYVEIAMESQYDFFSISPI